MLRIMLCCIVTMVSLYNLFLAAREGAPPAGEGAPAAGGDVEWRTSSDWRWLTKTISNLAKTE